MYIILVDMRQPDIRKFIAIKESNDFERLAEFTTWDDVLELHESHPLNVFDWLVINTDDYELTVL